MLTADCVVKKTLYLSRQSSGSSVSDIKTCNQTITQRRPETIVEYEYMHNIIFFVLFYSLLSVLLAASSDVFTKHNYNYPPIME